MGKTLKLHLDQRLIIALCVGLLAAAFALLPSGVNAASDDTQTLLENITPAANEETGETPVATIDGKQIVTVVLDATECQNDFSGTVQNALNNARYHYVPEGVVAPEGEDYITRIVVPDGTYHPTGAALEIYSNTILDLRGSGTEENPSGYMTPTDTTDDYGNVVIYKSTKNDDPPSLRCGHQDQYGGDDSYGYNFYQNMTVLGGTFIGHRDETVYDGPDLYDGNACNVRFGHASNVRVIGTKIQDNQGGHHLEIGACDGVRVEDCIFTGAKHGTATGNSKGNSLEAVQIDISHRENNNFAFYGDHDDLPTINAVITGCDFSNVVRGVGTHHAVFGHWYHHITVSNNTFTNIADCPIFFVYTKNALIENNTINKSYRGISFMYLTPLQQFQPNVGAAYTYSEAKNFSSSSTIRNNTIHLDASKSVDSHADTSTNPVKTGIFIAGENVTAANATSNYNEEERYNENFSKHKIPTGVHYLCGVTTSGNIIDVSAGGSKYYRAGILAEYAASCGINTNNIDLKGYNTDESAGHAGILVTLSPNVGLSGNTVRGVTRGKTTEGILITNCGGAKSTLVTKNKVYNAPQHGINCFKVTNKSLSVNGNEVYSAKGNGVFVSNSTISHVDSNKVSSPGINGILLVNSSSASYIKSNTITSPKKNGIMLWNKSKVTYNIESNTVKSAPEHGIFVGDPSGSYSKAFIIQKNTLTSCKKRGIYNGGWVNSIISNKVSSCGNKNKTYVKKGLSLTRYTATIKKGKTVKIGYIKSSAKGKIYWSTSNKKVATVNKYGTVKGVKKGTAYIYAKKNGVKVKAKITVN